MTLEERVRSIEDILEHLILIQFQGYSVGTETFNLISGHIRKRDEDADVREEGK